MNFRSDISALNADIIVEQLLRSHDPDGRWLDSEMLLQEVETILSFVLQNDDPRPLMTENCITKIEVFESKETLPYAISRISTQMLCPCIGENEIQARTMVLFELLKDYKWDAKAVIVLGALAATYGGLLLPSHLASCDSVAASIAAINKLPIEKTKFRPWLESLNLLVKAMVAVTKCIIKFERLPFKQGKLDNNIVGETLCNIYLATYRVVKSALACLQQILYFKKTQQATESRKAAVELSTESRRAAGELFSLGYQLLNVHTRLNKQVEECSTQIGNFPNVLMFSFKSRAPLNSKTHAWCYFSVVMSKEEEIIQRLRNINTGTHQDNQEVLNLIFSHKDDFPLQQYSRQVATTELKEKVILLLLSKPAAEPLFSLLQQLYDHPSNTNTEQNYEIIWIPIPSSQKWTNEEKEIFHFYSNSLPWISVRQPWLMNSKVLNFLRTEWHYGDDEAIVVVMDSNGKVVNMNAMDMVLIWGVKAYPFSVSRENEFWEEDNEWSMQLLLDGIHPAFETLVKEGREICIFGSDDLDWVEEFVSLARKIQNLGFQIELIYLSKRGGDERTIAMEESSILFNPTVQQLFWIRLESIKRSKLKLIESSKSDRVIEEVTKLLDFDYGKHKGWAAIGKGLAAVMVDGEKLTERMRRIVRWGEYAAGLGFTEAIEIAAEKPCEQTHTVVVPFEEASTVRVVTCEKCKRPMKRFVGYQ